MGETQKKGETKTRRDEKGEKGKGNIGETRCEGEEGVKEKGRKKGGKQGGKGNRWRGKKWERTKVGEKRERRARGEEGER